VTCSGIRLAISSRLAPSGLEAAQGAACDSDSTSSLSVTQIYIFYMVLTVRAQLSKTLRLYKSNMHPNPDFLSLQNQSQ
jgi:hypothetical protein